jgi:hypothetical protein
MKKVILFLIMCLVLISSVYATESVELESAEHYDENKIYLEDVTEAVYALDGNFSPMIFDQEWIKMTFDQPVPAENNILAVVLTIVPEETYNTEEDCFEFDDNKVLVCHYPHGNPAERHTIHINENAWPAHEARGDTLGSCSDGIGYCTTSVNNTNITSILHLYLDDILLDSKVVDSNLSEYAFNVDAANYTSDTFWLQIEGSPVKFDKLSDPPPEGPDEPDEPNPDDTRSAGGGFTGKYVPYPSELEKQEEVVIEEPKEDNSLLWFIILALIFIYFYKKEQDKKNHYY